MTQTKIDPTKANIEELRRWLAEQPCNGLYRDGSHTTAVCRCRGADRKPTGLAFPWASGKCRVPVSTFLPQHEGPGHHPNCGCRGSGRVPKAVGLEELMEQWVKMSGAHGPTLIWEHDHWVADLDTWTEIRGEDEIPLLAVLRAVVAQAKAEMG